MAEGADSGAAGKTTDAGNGGGGDTTDAGTGAGKTFTQDQVNDLIAREKGQVQSKYADYEALKAKAAEFDKTAEASKTEAQKAADKLVKAEGRATDLEGKVARYEAAAKAGLPLEHAARIQGSTPAELDEDAKTLAASLGGTGGRTNFDGGARGSGDEPQDMNSMIRRAAGRR